MRFEKSKRIQEAGRPLARERVAARPLEAASGAHSEASGSQHWGCESGASLGKSLIRCEPQFIHLLDGELNPDSRLFSED